MKDGGMVLRLAVPSDGALHEPALAFLRECGVEVMRANLRRYTADVPAVPGLSVLFQRSADITAKVEEGSADLGVVGVDRFLEFKQEGSDVNIVIDKLGFGRCELTMGVPDSWIDVTSVADLADLSMEFRDSGSDLQIATKYPRLVERFLLTNGVKYFSLVQSSGTLEAAPAMGYADVIVDILSTGLTMRENRLKTVHGGSVLTSEACLIANRAALAVSTVKLDRARAVVELIEAHLRALEFYNVTANMKGESPDQIADYLLEHTDISGLRGPTISKVHTNDGEGWYAVTIVIERSRLLEAVRHLRALGGTSVTVTQPNYVFGSESSGQAKLT